MRRASLLHERGFVALELSCRQKADRLSPSYSETAHKVRVHRVTDELIPVEAA